MEARGGGGRVFMFQTAPGNGGWIDLFRRTAAGPSSNSLAVFLYSLMPNDTDFTVTKAHGKPGLNYAFIGRQFDYHSPSSTPANLDRGSLQHMGEQVLSAARGAAFAAALPAEKPDAVYADIFGGPILAYPAWVGWIVLLAAAAMIAAAAWKVRPEAPPAVARPRRRRRRRPLPAVRVRRPVRAYPQGHGRALRLHRAAAAPGALRLVRAGAGAGRARRDPAHLPRRPRRQVLDPRPPCLRSSRAWAGACSAASTRSPLGAGVLGAGLAFVVFRKPLHPWWAWFGMLALGLLLGLALQVFAAAGGLRGPLAAAAGRGLAPDHPAPGQGRRRQPAVDDGRGADRRGRPRLADLPRPRRGDRRRGRPARGAWPSSSCWPRWSSSPCSMPRTSPAGPGSPAWSSPWVSSSSCASATRGARAIPRRPTCCS